MPLDKPPYHIDCSYIHRFYTIQEANTYLSLIGEEYQIVKEQDQNMWYVVPKINNMMIIGCTDEQ